MTVEIRPAHADDSAAIAPLLGELGYPASAAELPARLGVYESPDYAVLLAISDGSVVGLIGLHRMSSLHVAAPACYITGLIVSEGARRHGVGKRLLAEAETWAREHGCNRITVTSANKRQDAHAFYESSGFPHTGQRFVKTL